MPAPTATDEFILQLALQRGVLLPGQIDAARALARAGASTEVGVPASIEILVQQGVLTRRQIAELLAAEFRMPMAPDLATIRVTGDTLELVPRALAVRHRLLPVAREGGVLKVAIADPLDTDGVDALAHIVSLPIQPVVATA